MAKIALVLTLLFGGYSVQAEEFTLSVSAIFKNEAPYLKEWIEYHRLIGVDHFYLYNNGSSDSFRKILQPYIKEEVVTLIHWPDRLGLEGESTWSLSTQLSAYENALKWKALGQTKWLIFLDIDEFLVPPENETIGEFLERYDEYPGIVLSSEYYDASLRGNLPQKKLVIESLELTSPHCKSVQKTILKPELCTSFVWPPYECRFKNEERPAKAAKQILRINQYENRMKFQKVDHVRQPLPLDAENLSDQEICGYLENGYGIRDEKGAACRYVPHLYKKLGL